MLSNFCVANQKLDPYLSHFQVGGGCIYRVGGGYGFTSRYELEPRSLFVAFSGWWWLYLSGWWGLCSQPRDWDRFSQAYLLDYF
jgi:hypothetical protein